MAKRSACIVPATRMERRKSPKLMPAVRIGVAAFLAVADLPGRVFRYSAVPPAAKRNRTSHTPVFRGFCAW